jgi:hypothetical protein
MKAPAKRKIADHEMAVMGRIYDLLATLAPPRRQRVYQFIGERLDDLPVIAQVIGEADPTPMFPDATERRKQREASSDDGKAA